MVEVNLAIACNDTKYPTFNPTDQPTENPIPDVYKNVSFQLIILIIIFYFKK